LVALVLDVRVFAQDTNATCTLASLQWSFNSEKQSPCVIASSLLGVCNGGDYNVVALPSADSEYLGPTIDSANPCQCSTVVYSLMSACALCQNGTTTTWSQWTTNCGTVFTTYPEPIPGQLHVPAYAYLDVESKDVFDPNAASQDANATESTGVPTSSATHSKTSATTPQTSSALPSTSASSSSPTTPTNSTVTGAVVGSFLGLACIILATGLFFTYRRRRRARALRRTSGSDEEALESPPTRETSPANMSEVQIGASRLTVTDNGRSTPNVPSISVSSASERGSTH
jgi:hypothetical protein